MTLQKPYRQALSDRLNLINDIGESQTTWEKLKAARDKARQEQQDSLDWQRNQLSLMQQGQNNANSIAGSIKQGGSSGFDAFMRAIGQKESSGNYGAVNKNSGALGKYQIMPGNFVGKGGWDYNALGYDVTANQFLKSPQIQEAVAKYQLQKYYDKYGPAGASIAWYAGPGAAQKYANTGKVSNFAQGIYPSIAAYMNAIVGRL